MKRPNILWFCTDQQRFDTIFNLGYSYARTPNIDKFMTESTTFSHAFCQSPVCTPSRSSFLTGSIQVQYQQTKMETINSHEKQKITYFLKY